jgi:hypothetical protein
VSTVRCRSVHITPTSGLQIMRADYRIIKAETSPLCDVHLLRNGSNGDLVSTATALRSGPIWSGPVQPAPARSGPVWSGPRLEFRYSSRFLYSPKSPDRLWGPSSRLFRQYMGCLSGLMRPRLKVHSSAACSAEAKNKWGCTATALSSKQVRLTFLWLKHTDRQRCR